MKGESKKKKITLGDEGIGRLVPDQWVRVRQDEKLTSWVAAAVFLALLRL